MDGPGSPGDLGHAEPHSLLTQDASHTQEVASQRRLEDGGQLKLKLKGVMFLKKKLNFRRPQLILNLYRYITGLGQMMTRLS